MKTWVRKSLNVGVLSAGFLLVSGGAAHADWTTGYNAGLLNGNQFDTTVQVPINLCGNSIALLGFADASCGGGAVAWDAESASVTESATATESATTEDWTSGYNVGLLNGNQFDTTLQVPVNVCGNSVAVLGFSSANCGGGATAVDGDIAGDNGHHHKRKHRGGNGGGQGNNNGGYVDAQGDYTESVGNRTEDWTSGFNVGALNGNQFDTTVQAPINVAGNSLALLGFSSASSAGGAWAVDTESARAESATTEDWTTGYNAGLLNGNQFDTTLQLPINLCGNSIAILGFSSASCGGGAVAVDGGAGSGAGQGNGHGHGNGGGWGDDDDRGNGNGGYGDADDAGYGNGGNASNNNAYSHATGDASGMMNASAGKAAHKAKKKNKSQSINLDEHGKRHGTGTANDHGYGANANNAGYGDGGAMNNGGGYGDNNGGGWGDDDNGRGGDRGGRHHGGGMGGANAVKGGCSDWTTGYNVGLLNGNQFDTTLQVPINISGNSLGILGLSQAQSAGGAVAYSC
ncbi:chaplin family protein [Dactylosporangium sp. AC04546]|uniref:chaplin family protein n=1 Tax=Dactylosporangium sp. AC04546 TaxID=2862460 RepID=UPI001EDE7A2D|nr:chaplin family protein [Dactylosporangium sp. AC04546]WVK83910.1 chaplin family protein [Dactylosporangium sp. AC04546]